MGFFMENLRDMEGDDDDDDEGGGGGRRTRIIGVAAIVAAAGAIPADEGSLCQPSGELLGHLGRHRRRFVLPCL